jgi:hypothetical protein
MLQLGWVSFRPAASTGQQQQKPLSYFYPSFPLRLVQVFFVDLMA